MFLEFLISSVMASSYVACDVLAKVISTSNDNLRIEVLTIKDQNTGFGHCGVTKKEYEVRLKEKQKFKKGRVINLRYTSSSAMGEKGPVNSKTWTLKE